MDSKPAARGRDRDGNSIGIVVFDPQWIFAVAVLLATPAFAQSAGDAAAPDQDAVAVCTTWQLTTQAMKLAQELNATATDRADWARKLVQECKDRQCPREQLIDAEQEVREAGYQQVRSKELVEAMEQRRAKLLAHFEELRGKDAIERCGKVSQ